MSLNAMDKNALRQLAESGTLDPHAIDFLADTRDVQTATALTRNLQVRLTTHAMRALAELGRKNNAIARQLVSRPEVSVTIVRSLYPYVNPDLQAYLRTYFPIEATANDDRRPEDVFDATDFMPGENLIRAAEKFARYGLLNIAVMIQALEHGKIPTFIAFFARYTGLPSRSVHGFLCESCPKGLAIACCAVAVRKSEFTRIYLLTNRVRGAGRPVDHAEMLSTLNYFDRVDSAVAQRLVRRFKAA